MKLSLEYADGTSEQWYVGAIEGKALLDAIETNKITPSEGTADLYLIDDADPATGDRLPRNAGQVSDSVERVDPSRVGLALGILLKDREVK